MNSSTTSPNPTGSTHAKPSDSPPIRSSSFRRPPSLEASEKKLTLFALCLAIIEKTEHGFGKLAFFWAIVVFKGYVSALKPIEFWFVSGIFLVQVTRIFSPKATTSHPLPDYMLQRTCLPKDVQGTRIFSCMATSSHPLPDYMRQRTWLRKDVQGTRIFSRMGTSSQLLPDYMLQWTWLPKDVQGTRIFSCMATFSHPLLDYMLLWTWLPKDIQILLVFVLKLLHWLQILAATACVTLSLMRLGQQDFGEEVLHNQKFVLIVFYILVLVEALLYLLEKGYWTWIIEHRKLFKQVIEELELGPTGTIFLHLFFNDVHTKCIDGNFFDGLKMNLISFAEKLNDANSLFDQIIGAKILVTLNRSLNDAEHGPNNANCD